MSTHTSTAQSKALAIVIDLTESYDEGDSLSVNHHVTQRLPTLIRPQITSSISEESDLLRLAQDAGNSQVAVSGDQLKILLRTIADLGAQATIFPSLTSGTSSPDLQMVSEKPGLGCKSFTLFPKLPLELRTMIWESAADAPQVHSFVYDFGASSFQSGNPAVSAPESITRTSRLSSLRSVCFESRAAAAKAIKRMSLSRLLKEGEDEDLR
ncbi:hypothetical protein VTL71DRAFT_5737 [Oculimacula yallundae]|uniref:2EXR domain-containing protein n=1 Tax=Oculimacula yallundae TaxID=86028 RepID=A0ABR4BYE2_9HELO